MASTIEIQDFPLWNRLIEQKAPVSFDLEITARCNNKCRHCYINLPAGDEKARSKELSPEEISRLADEAVSLGTMWCLITGGEPLLREDFPEIYTRLKRKGLLVSVFTNGTLIREDHVRLFRQYPPRDIEVSVYGVTRETYEAVTGRAGSFAEFRRGLDLLLDSGVKVRLKAMVMRANVAELPAIASFCRERTKDFFRFDWLLHMRYDGNERRNADIRAQRLSPAEIVAAEQADEERSYALRKNCSELILNDRDHESCTHLFHCSGIKNSFCISYDGWFRPCSDLWHPDCVYDLRKGTVAGAWLDLVPRVQEIQSSRKEFLEHCQGCQIINLCPWCPARAHLETGEMDKPVEYFCQVAHARAYALKQG